jgi:hypothetical protein
LGRKTLLRDIDSDFDAILSVGVRGSLYLINRYYSSLMNGSEEYFPNQMKKRGFYPVEDPSKDNLPGYYYRDDGYKAWFATRKYVETVIKNSFPEEDYVSNLISLPRVIWTLNLLLETEAKMTKAPQLDPASPEDLIDFLTHIIFTAVFQHSAVNNGQLHWYGFIPNRPLSLHLGFPANGNVTEEYIIRALPRSEDMVKKTLSTARALTAPLPKEFTLKAFKNKGPFPEFCVLVEELEQYAENVIKKRKAQFEGVRYDYFLPERLPISIFE